MRGNHETALDCETGEVPCPGGGGASGAQWCDHEHLELADASDLWIAADHFLASAGPAGAGQDPLRTIWWRARPADALASSHSGALEPDDARGAREIRARYERALWPIRAAGHRTHGVTASHMLIPGNEVRLPAVTCRRA